MPASTRRRSTRSCSSAARRASRKCSKWCASSSARSSIRGGTPMKSWPPARDHRSPGRCQLVGPPSAPRAVPQVEVAFDIDANGIVNVTAKDMATGRQQKITISGSSGLAKDDVDRLVKEAQSHASEDQARRDLIEARNTADSLAYQTERTVADNREKVPVGELSKIEAAIAEVRRLALGDDLAAIRKATDDL